MAISISTTDYRISCYRSVLTGPPPHTPLAQDPPPHTPLARYRGWRHCQGGAITPVSPTHCHASDSFPKVCCH
ncbi:hypothetical protein JTE90_022678 [Oedothorax gibbosus]|uniref:Uncharacterized protein n=1 Tax=Oedothorax gibbosus TaxID=931172 RepID=A0AAV6UKF8_9ARAC|nr:hypothetical protein JTE90_022678 [Oedothorax gibbosus]